MAATRFRGVFPMLPTPFDDSGAIAFGDVERLTAHVLESGAAGVAALGLAGEAIRLDERERMAVAERVVRIADGAPVIIGVSAQTTDAACRLARHAAGIGVALVMVAPPNAAALTRAALTDHYLAIADAGGASGVMVQDAPGFVDVDLGAAFIRRLADACPNIRAVKAEGAPVGERIGDMVDTLAGTSLPVFGGNGGLHAIDALDAGAHGMMPGCECPAEHVALLRAHANGDRARAVTLYEQLLPLLAFQMQTLDFYIACNKELLCRRGLIGTPTLRTTSPLGRRSREALALYASQTLAHFR